MRYALAVEPAPFRVTNSVVDTIIVCPNGPSGPKDIEVAGGALWTAVPNISSVARVDLATHQVDKVLFARLETLVSNGDTVFVITGGGISEIEPITTEVVRNGGLVSVGKVDRVYDAVRFGQEIFVRTGGPDDTEGDGATRNINHHHTDIYSRP